MKKTAILIIALDVTLLGIALYVALNNPVYAVKIRQILFTRFVTRPDVFNASPPELIKEYGFKTDSPAAISDSRTAVSKTVNVHEVPPVAENAIATAKALVLLFSKNGGDGCGEYGSLLENIARLPTGNGLGCCSDHTQAFLALSAESNLFARELHTSQHTTNEFYDPQQKKWIWIDPLFALLAKSRQGRYLSLLEMRAAYFKGEQVLYECFGNRFHIYSTRNAATHPYFDQPEDFSDISMTFGNNVFQEDSFRQGVHMLPKPLSQFLAIISGKQPYYVMLLDHNSTGASQLRYLKRCVLAAACFLTFLTVFSVIYLIRFRAGSQA